MAGSKSQSASWSPRAKLVLMVLVTVPLVDHWLGFQLMAE